MDPNYGCMGHSQWRSSGPLHRLEIDFGLCSLHQWQIQGRVVALRSVLYFTLRLQILIKTYCSWYLALRSNCIPGYWKLSSSPCSAVNIELFTTNIPLNALEFSVSTFLIQ